MRTTILAWSTFSGLALGFIAGFLLFALLVLGGELAPAMMQRLGGRVRGVATLITLVIIPIAGGVLGWLEGRLKLQ